MTREEQIAIITKINDYAEKELKDIDPQKTKISYQLDKVKPIMEEMAKEYHTTLEDIFILYMDMASEVATKEEHAFQSQLKENL